MDKSIHRRRLIKMVVGLTGASASIDPARAAGASPTGGYHWEYIRTECTDGIAREYWCYRYCDLYGCEDLYCEWRVAGNC